MPKILVPKTMPSRQIEFPDDVKRSKPGALYFSPGVMKDITKEEYEYMLQHHKKFASSLVVLSDKDKIRKAGKKNEASNVATGPKTVKSQAKLRAEARLQRANHKVSEKPSKSNEPNKVNAPHKAVSGDDATGHAGSDVSSQSGDTSNTSKKDGHQKGNK